MNPPSHRLSLSCVAALCMTLLIQSPTRADTFAQQLNRWLDEPDVRLVAVELYADWCEPCRAAAPRWEMLRQRYAHKGLKLVVVNIDQPTVGERCGALPWRPDVSLCDPGIARELGVGGKIPQAFVWSWQGNLLVDRGGHVDQIERVIRDYLDDNPRVVVEAVDTAGEPDLELKRQVESVLAQDGKITLVTDQQERTRLRELQRQTHGADRRDDQRCDLGQEVSPNLFLRAERFPKSLSLSLQSLESQCTRPVSTTWHDDRPLQSVRKAVYALKSRMIHRPAKMPSTGAEKSPVVEDRRLKSKGEAWTAAAGGPVSIIRFQTSPPGATVIVDGRPVCQKTPCARALTSGPHEATLVLSGHQNLYETLQVDGDKALSFTLKGDSSRLTIETEPRGLQVLVDGREVGTSPVNRFSLPKGPHRLTVRHPCYIEETADLNLKQGETRRMRFAPEPRPAGLRVSAQSARGDDVRAQVYIDGQPVGETPDTFTVGVCSTRIEVRSEADGVATSTLNLTEREVTELSVTLRGDPSASDLLWTLVWDFRQSIWASAAQLVRRYETACDAGDLLACKYRSWHRPDGALLDGAIGPMSIACEEGNALGCLVAGWAMTQRQGSWGEPTNEGVDPNLGHALIKRGCELGLNRACIELGRLYDRGVGTPRRRKRAAKLYKRTCNAGDARGCNNLAAMYVNGLGVRQDRKRAMALYKSACAAQNPLACFNLAQNLRTPGANKGNKKKATRLYVRACGMGNALACLNAGVMHEKGSGVGKSIMRAREHYDRGCSAGHAPCCAALKRLVPKEEAREAP